MGAKTIALLQGAKTFALMFMLFSISLYKPAYRFRRQFRQEIVPSPQSAVVAVGSTSTGTVTLISPAPAGGTVVTLGAVQGQIVIPPKVTVRREPRKRASSLRH